MLLLYSCGDRHPMPKGDNLTNGFKTTLSADEQQNFNTLKRILDIIIKYLQNQLIDNPNLKTLEKNQYQKLQEKQSQDIINKYPDFIEWLSNYPDKQKELANDFSIVYEFLNEKRIQQASNLTNEQLIINTINCDRQLQDNDTCNDKDYMYTNNKNVFFGNNLYFYFYNFLIHMNNTKTNEEIFESMKLEPYRNIDSLIGKNRYENAIRKTLNHNQKKGLNFLKEAFFPEIKLHNFLILNKNKVKSVLNHIYSEFEKCNSNEQGKDIFKYSINNYFDVINNKKLDEFQEKVKSGC